MKRKSVSQQYVGKFFDILYTTNLRRMVIKRKGYKSSNALRYHGYSPIRKRQLDIKIILIHKDE